ncbi:MAG: MobF family relaxase [Acidimicrobiales bacterium]
MPTGVLGDRQIEPMGSWAGRGVVALGLGGTVTPEAWRSVLSGRDPAHDRELSPNQRRVKVAGFDLTFCAPKSVSVLATLGEKEIAERVISGHTRAVSEAFSYLEEHGLAVRRQAGSGRTFSGDIVPDDFSEGNAGRMVLPVGGALGASFLHRTSRSLDPHLHTHTVVANLGFSGSGSGIGSGPSSIQASLLDWSALDGRGLYAHRAAADALYHAVLRYELASSLGVEWNMPVRGRADIKGIPRDVIDEFSRRQAQVTEQLDSIGLGADASSRARYIAGVVTRSEKDLSISADDLVTGWRERAVHRGLGPRQLEGVLGRSSMRFLEEGEIAARMSSAGERTVDALMEKGSPVCRRELVRAWSSLLPGGAPSERIGNAVDSVLDAARESGWSDGIRTSRRVGVGEERYKLSMIKNAIACRRDLPLEQSMTSHGRQFEMQGLEQSRDARTGVAGMAAERSRRSVDDVDRWMQRIGKRPVIDAELAVWIRAKQNILSYCERWSPGGGTHTGPNIDPRGRSREDSQGDPDLHIGHPPGTARDVESGPAYGRDGPRSGKSSLVRLAETNDLERMVRQTRLRLHMEPEQFRDQGKGMELGY